MTRALLAMVLVLVGASACSSTSSRSTSSHSTPPTIAAASRGLACPGGGRYTVSFGHGTLHAGGQDFVDVEFRLISGASCHIARPVTVSIEHDHQLLAGVHRNPLRQPTDLRLTRSQSIGTVSPDWTNWCGSQLSGVSMVVSYRDKPAGWVARVSRRAQR